MDLVFEDNSPIRCRAVGLDCETCVARSARDIAACCVSLNRSGLTQIFSSLYTSEACAPMSEFFSDVYVSALSAKMSVAAA